MRNPEQSYKKIFWKNFLKYLSIIMLVLISVGLVYISIQSDIDVQIIKSEEKRINENRMIVITENYTSIITDLLFLSEQNEINIYIENPDLVIKDLLSLEYELMIRNKKVYDQIRYINEYGDVVVGVKNDKDDISVSTDLGNLSEEAVFIQTMDLEKGEVFTSPIELVKKQTNNGVELKQVMYFSTRVFSSQNESKGVILLDYDAQDLLNKLKLTSEDTNDELFITGAQGFYLLRPPNAPAVSVENSYFGSKLFYDDFPKAWEYINSNKLGQFLIDDGIFTFDSVNPEIIVNKMDLNELGFSGLAISPDMINEHEIKIISYYPIDRIASKRKDLALKSLGYLGIGLPVILFVCFIAARLNILRKQTDEAYNLSSKVFDSTKEGMLIADEKATIINVNQSLLVLTGFTRGDLIGKSSEFLISETQKEGTNELIIENLMKTGEWFGELILIRKNNDPFYASISVSSIKDEDEKLTNFIAVINDITEKINAEKYLKFLATHDILTQLPNRTMLYESINHAIQNSHDFGTFAAVFFIDIDGFKTVNDTYGHQAGDLVLQEIAKRLVSNVRDGDTIARISGDEFACVFSSITSHEAARKMGEKLLEKLSEGYKINKNLISISASIGISLFPDDANNAEKLLLCADQAMYEIKNRSKNGVFLFSDFNPQKNQ